MQPKSTSFLLVSCLAVWIQTPSSLLAQDEVLVQALNDFSHDVYKRLAKENDNLCVSAASISAVLLMAHAGARGKTEAEMARVLYLTRFDNGKKTTSLDGTQLRTAVANLLRCGLDELHRTHEAVAAFGQGLDEPGRRRRV